MQLTDLQVQQRPPNKLARSRIAWSTFSSIYLNGQPPPAVGSAAVAAAVDVDSSPAELLCLVSDGIHGDVGSSCSSAYDDDSDAALVCVRMITCSTACLREHAQAQRSKVSGSIFPENDSKSIVILKDARSCTFYYAVTFNYLRLDFACFLFSKKSFCTLQCSRTLFYTLA